MPVLIATTLTGLGFPVAAGSDSNNTDSTNTEKSRTTLVRRLHVAAHNFRTHCLLSPSRARLGATHHQSRDRDGSAPTSPVGFSALLAVDRLRLHVTRARVNDPTLSGTPSANPIPPTVVRAAPPSDRSGHRSATED